MGNQFSITILILFLVGGAIGSADKSSNAKVEGTIDCDFSLRGLNATQGSSLSIQRAFPRETFPDLYRMPDGAFIYRHQSIPVTALLNSNEVLSFDPKRDLSESDRSRRITELIEAEGIHGLAREQQFQGTHGNSPRLTIAASETLEENFYGKTVLTHQEPKLKILATVSVGPTNPILSWRRTIGKDSKEVGLIAPLRPGQVVSWHFCFQKGSDMIGRSYYKINDMARFQEGAKKWSVDATGSRDSNQVIEKGLEELIRSETVELDNALTDLFQFQGLTSVAQMILDSNPGVRPQRNQEALEQLEKRLSSLKPHKSDPRVQYYLGLVEEDIQAFSPHAQSNEGVRQRFEAVYEALQLLKR